jgi:hypothetical protein
MAEARQVERRALARGLSDGAPGPVSALAYKDQVDRALAAIRTLNELARGLESVALKHR